MPYKTVGKNVMHFKNGKWTVKQHCSSVANAKAAVRLLHGVEHGDWKPTGKPVKKKSPALKAKKKKGS